MAALAARVIGKLLLRGDSGNLIFLVVIWWLGLRARFHLVRSRDRVIACLSVIIVWVSILTLCMSCI